MCRRFGRDSATGYEYEQQGKKYNYEYEYFIYALSNGVCLCVSRTQSVHGKVLDGLFIRLHLFVSVNVALLYELVECYCNC